jgi:hypothetical protein
MPKMIYTNMSFLLLTISYIGKYSQNLNLSGNTLAAEKGVPGSCPWMNSVRK